MDRVLLLSCYINVNERPLDLSPLRYSTLTITNTLLEYFPLYINNCPTRCNTKQSIYYSASSLYMFRVSNTPIIRSTQNCNYSHRYWSYFLCSYLPPTWPRGHMATLEGGSCTSTQNCNYSLRYWSYFLCNYLPPTWPRGHVGGRYLISHFCYTA